MLRAMMKTKIHRVTVTQADLLPSVVSVDADNAILATGFDPAETFGSPGLARGDIISR